MASVHNGHIASYIVHLTDVTRCCRFALASYAFFMDREATGAQEDAWSKQRRRLECSTTRRGVALALSGRGVGGASGPGSSGQHGSHAGTGRGTDDTPTGRAPRAQPRRARPWAAGTGGGRRPRVAAPRAATSGRGAWPRFPFVSIYRLGGLVLHCT